jgi:hypothetical protein
LLEEWKITHNMAIKNKITQPPVPPTVWTRAQSIFLVAIAPFTSFS